MAFHHSLDRQDDVVSEINMVPLIDVMLVLLIIFILAMPVMTHTVPLDLPRAPPSPQVARPDAIQLSVAADGNAFWNEEQLDDNQLAQRLSQAAQQQPQPDVFLRGDRRVAYEHVTRVLAAVQRAGLSKLSFVTQPDH
ncbi:MAG TPA: biopolymer transporter ExbD [Aquabacterium sp.]|nr:biopolymer transporter ExbD [Aquabacterium sp.]